MRQRKTMFALAMMMTSVLATTVAAYAYEAPLTDLFYTDAFSGSWKVFSKFNVLGMIMQFIISAFCLMGLFFIIFQRMVTLLYLSARNTFDKVDELHKSVSSTRFMGLPGIFKDNLYESKNGIGLESFVSFFLSLMPNIKAYSDYNPEKRRYGLQEDDTVTTYMLKVSLPTIMLMFFFSVGFNGTLFKAYGNVVDAMATAADSFVTTDLSSTVQKWVNSGSGYQFTSDTTQLGEFKLKVKKDMYAKILRKSDDLSTNAKLTIGSKIDAYVDKGISLSTLKSHCTDFDGDDDDCKNLQYTITINGTSKFDGAVKSGWQGKESGIALTTFGINSDTGSKMYLHLIINKKDNANETNYFKVNGSKSDSGSGGKQGNIK